MRLSKRLALRFVLGLVALSLHGALGRYLAGLDPIDELVSGERIPVLFAAIVFFPLRAFVWFVLPVWLTAGTIADLFDARSQPKPRAQP